MEDILTARQFDAIEAAVSFTLPDAHRRAVLWPPFRPIGRDAIHWFSGDPSEVIGRPWLPSPTGPGGNRGSSRSAADLRAIHS